MTNENEEQEKNRTVENLSAVGQMIVGQIETIGGILTADPITQAEGEFNVEVGTLHKESNKTLTAIENNERTESDKTEKSTQTEQNQK